MLSWRMVRALALLLTALLTASPASAKKVWRPKPIFTAALCSQAEAAAGKALDQKLETAGIATPGQGSRDARANGAYIDFMTEIDRAIRARARIQAQIAGKWKGPTRYKTVTFQGRHFRIASCQMAKTGIPLSRALRIAESEAEPTATDKIIAETVRGYMQIKNARRVCRGLRPFKKARHCLSQYPDDWLDRYPM